MPYQELPEKKIICPHCGEEVPQVKRCPNCGQFLPKPAKMKWKMPTMTPVEVFLVILGSIMLLVGLVAV